MWRQESKCKPRSKSGKAKWCRRGKRGPFVERCCNPDEDDRRKMCHFTDAVYKSWEAYKEAGEGKKGKGNDELSKKYLDMLNEYKDYKRLGKRGERDGVEAKKRTEWMNKYMRPECFQCDAFCHNHEGSAHEAKKGIKKIDSDGKLRTLAEFVVRHGRGHGPRLFEEAKTAKEEKQERGKTDKQGFTQIGREAVAESMKAQQTKKMKEKKWSCSQCKQLLGEEGFTNNQLKKGDRRQCKTCVEKRLEADRKRHEERQRKAREEEERRRKVRDEEKAAAAKKAGELEAERSKKAEEDAVKNAIASAAAASKKVVSVDQWVKDKFQVVEAYTVNEVGFKCRRCVEERLPEAARRIDRYRFIDWDIDPENAALWRELPNIDGEKMIDLDVLREKVPLLFSCRNGHRFIDKRVVDLIKEEKDPEKALRRRKQAEVDATAKKVGEFPYFEDRADMRRWIPLSQQIQKRRQREGEERSEMMREGHGSTLAEIDAKIADFSQKTDVLARREAAKRAVREAADRGGRRLRITRRKRRRKRNKTRQQKSQKKRKTRRRNKRGTRRTRHRKRRPRQKNKKTRHKIPRQS